MDIDLRDLIVYQLERERQLVAGMQQAMQQREKQHADEKASLLRELQAATAPAPPIPPAPRPRRARKVIGPTDALEP